MAIDGDTCLVALYRRNGLNLIGNFRKPNYVIEISSYAGFDRYKGFYRSLMIVTESVIYNYAIEG